jgi:hypothetical protein
VTHRVRDVTRRRRAAPAITFGYERLAAEANTRLNHGAADTPLKGVCLALISF